MKSWLGQVGGRVNRLALSLVLWICATPFARSVEWEADRWDGATTFSILLQMRGFTPLKHLDQLLERPSESMLVVLGDTSIIQMDGLQKFARFLSGGGAVLLATDRVFPREAWIVGQRLGFEVAGKQVLTKRGPHAYRDLEFCPRISHDVNPSHAVFQRVRSIATNRPSYLQPTNEPDPTRWTLTPLAEFPSGCYTRKFPRSIVRNALPENAAFAGVHASGNTKLLVLADHSVFIDEMMLQFDNDNLRFAGNCLAWLSEGGRNRLLFLDQGFIRTDFGTPTPDPKIPDLNLPDIELPTLNEMVPPVNKLIRSMEDENLINRLVFDLLPGSASRDKDALVRNVWRNLAVLSALAIAAFGLYRLDLGRYRSGGKRKTSTRNLLLNRGDLFGQRNLTMLHDGNLWDAAHNMIRIQLEQASGWKPNDTTDPVAMPTLWATGSWLRRRHLRRQFDELWRLAYDSRPRVISRRRFVRLQTQLREVCQALADGSMRVSDNESPLS